MPSPITLMSLLATLLLLPCQLTGKPAPAQGNRLTVPLFGFESQAEIETFKIRRSVPPTVFSLSDKHVTQGKHSVLFSAPSSPDYPYPAAITPKLKERRLHLFKTIIVDVYNATDKRSSFDLYFNYRDGVNHAIYNSYYLEPRKQQTLRIGLPSGFEAPLQQLHIYKDRPSADIVIHIDNIRLESEEFAVLLGNASAALRRVTAIAAAAPANRSLQATQTRLATELESLREETTRGVDWLADLHGFVKRTREALQEHNRWAAKAVVTRFERAAKSRSLWYGWADGMQKIARDGETPFDLSLSPTMQLSAARNEYEGIQLVLRSTKPHRDVRVSVSDLTAATGSVLPSSRIEILPVGYVNTAKASPTRYLVDYRGWHPDPLLDFLTEFGLPAGKWQPIWLDVYVPAEQKPGLYKGTVTVLADGASGLTVPFEVRVWPFVLPKQQSFTVASALEAWRKDLTVYDREGKARGEFMAYAKGKKPADGLSPAAERMRKLDIQFQDTLLKHRLNPSSIYTSYPQRIDELLRWKEAGANKFNIIYIPSMSHMPIGVGDKCPAWFKNKFLGILRKRVPELKKAGLLGNAYIYCFDEIPPRQYSAAADLLSAVKREFPDIPVVSTCARAPGLEGLVDIWIGGLVGYDRVKGEIKTSRNVWPYVCNGPFDPYPNLFIEYSGQGQRLLTGFMPFRYGWGGFLYYEFLGWRDSALKVFEVITTGPLTKFNGRGYGGSVNGDGFIFYPGPTGAMSSIRAKCLRDGLEDYEMLCLLRQRLADARAGKAATSADWVRRTEEALRVSPMLFESLNSYTRDSKVILQERDRIAGLLTEGGD
jgi:hypothetical protein